MLQWVGLGAFTTVLVGELRPHKLCIEAKKKKKKRPDTAYEGPWKKLLIHILQRFAAHCSEKA